MHTPEIKQHYSAGVKINGELLQKFNEAEDRHLLGESGNKSHCEEVDLDKLDEAAQATADFLRA